MLCFVYGTLKSGYQNCARIMTNQKLIGEAHTEPAYRLFNCGAFPAMVLDTRLGISIKGELWEVDAECVKRMDRLEGHPHFYKRLPVRLDSHPGLEVVAYIFQHKTTGLPPLGDSWDL